MARRVGGTQANPSSHCRRVSESAAWLSLNDCCGWQLRAVSATLLQRALISTYEAIGVHVNDWFYECVLQQTAYLNAGASVCDSDVGQYIACTCCFTCLKLMNSPTYGCAMQVTQTVLTIVTV